MSNLEFWSDSSSELQGVDFFGQILRFLDNGSDLLFVAKDVAAILEYGTASDAVRILDDDEKLLRTLCVSGQNREVNLITEGGLYSLILRSKKKEAKIFKKWVTSEVLPAIRRNGQYGNHQVPQTFAQALQLAADQAVRLEMQQRQIEEMEPKAKAAEIMLMSEDTITVAEFAKSIHKGPNKFLKKLREDKILIDSGNRHNLPYQRYLDAGYFEVKEKSEVINNKVKLFHQTRVTPKGQVYLTTKYA